jgi:hypothetical protein
MKLHHLGRLLAVRAPDDEHLRKRRQRRQAALAALGLLLKLGAGAALGYTAATRGGDWVGSQGRRISLLQRLGAGVKRAVVGVFWQEKKGQQKAGSVRVKGSLAGERRARLDVVPA